MKACVLILFFALAICCNGQAAERKTVCATYKPTNRSYKVEATLLMGSELNQKTNSFDYVSFSKYVVIFWKENQTSIIELDFSFGPGPFGTDGKDQQGREWEISTSTTFCY